MKNLQSFLEFILERHRIYERRKAGQPAPWTDDPILRKYRFCNIYRENDPVTVWITNNLFEPLKDSPHLVTAMAAARLINKPETLAVIKNRIIERGWDTGCEEDIRSLAAQGKAITNAAYMVTTPEGMDKAAGISFMVNSIHEAKIEKTSTLAELAAELMKHPRIGTFIAAQIVCDCSYAPRFIGCSDWWSFALSGPGSRRGLNYVYGRPFDAPWEEADWHKHLRELASPINQALEKAGFPKTHARNHQNAACEFNKYARAKLGVAEPKQLYRQPESKPQPKQASLF
jgi:hypothetical protein